MDDFFPTVFEGGVGYLVRTRSTFPREAADCLPDFVGSEEHGFSVVGNRVVVSNDLDDVVVGETSGSLNWSAIKLAQNSALFFGLQRRVSSGDKRECSVGVLRTQDLLSL